MYVKKVGGLYAMYDSVAEAEDEELLCKVTWQHLSVRL
jgi:hypothetical protein